jgi:hypothetical protein
MDYVAFSYVLENFGSNISVCDSVISDVDIEADTTVADLSSFPNLFD